MKLLTLFLFLFITACNSSEQNKNPESSNPSNTAKANITAVTAQGNESNYTFHVTIKSDETGCEQYADWWEILKADGTLVYRRILAHSHPDDQPFTRSGEPVKVTQNETLYIRAHMNKLGYVGDVFTGNVADGFTKAENLPNFSQNIDEQEPLPSGCTS